MYVCVCMCASDRELHAMWKCLPTFNTFKKIVETTTTTTSSNEKPNTSESQHSLYYLNELVHFSSCRSMLAMLCMCVCMYLFFSIKFVYFFTLLKLIIPYSKENPCIKPGIKHSTIKLYKMYAFSVLLHIFHLGLFQLFFTFFCLLLFFLMKFTGQLIYNKIIFQHNIIDTSLSILYLFILHKMLQPDIAYGLSIW